MSINNQSVYELPSQPSQRKKKGFIFGPRDATTVALSDVAAVGEALVSARAVKMSINSRKEIIAMEFQFQQQPMMVMMRLKLDFDDAAINMSLKFEGLLWGFGLKCCREKRGKYLKSESMCLFAYLRD